MAKYTDEKKLEIEQEKQQKKLLRNKDVKASIRALVEEGKYDEVFVNYGREAYRRFVPRKVRREDFKKLKQKGKYEDIYRKYGEKEYGKLLFNAMYDEIKENKGFFSAALWKAKKIAKETLLTTAIFGMTTTVALPTTLSFSTTDSIHANTEEYASEISEYNKRNEAYAETFGDVEVSKLQIIMKSMDDMWKSIKGYKTPSKDIEGYLELDLATEEGYGVCRNMAADVAKRLNAIDKNFNARIMPVLMGDEGGYQIADIERTIIENDATVKSDEEGKETSTPSIEDQIASGLTSAFGNHMVALADIPEDNIILVIDPTNPGLGIYQNGRILMLNDSLTDKDFEYDSKEISSLAVVRGAEAVGEIAADYLNSFQKPRLSVEELKAKYGTPAQNKALTEVRALFAAKQAMEEPSFDERIKVDMSKITGQKSKDEVTRQEKEAREGDELTH